MAEGLRALCNDFYVNQKLSVKLDLPRSRETVLDLFERVRRQFPGMQAFKRYKDELALETPAGGQPHRWLAIRANNIRSGVVNPETFDDAYGLHRLVLESAPYFLSISPLDVEYLELLYGFDMAASGRHDRIVARALMGDSPLERLVDVPGARVIDFQPVIGLSLGGPAVSELSADWGFDGVDGAGGEGAADGRSGSAGGGPLAGAMDDGGAFPSDAAAGEAGEGSGEGGRDGPGAGPAAGPARGPMSGPMPGRSAGGGGTAESRPRPIEAHFEVKTRAHGGRAADGREDPISVYVTLRAYDPVGDLKELASALERVRRVGEALVHERVVPSLLAPIRQAIALDDLGGV